METFIAVASRQLTAENKHLDLHNVLYTQNHLYPASKYMFKVNNTKTRTR